jgi:hypothetical protein
VPSSCTATSRPEAHRSKSEALRALVTTWISSTSGTPAIASRIQSMIGLPATGSSSFAIRSVSGRKRVA